MHVSIQLLWSTGHLLHTPGVVYRTVRLRHVECSQHSAINVAVGTNEGFSVKESHNVLVHDR